MGDHDMSFEGKAQQAELRRILDRVDWDQVEAELPTMEELLLHAIEVTEPEFGVHEHDLDPDLGEERLTVSSEEIDAMNPDVKLAYVCYPLRTVALLYGLKGAQALEQREGSIAELIRKLNDMVQLPALSDP